MIVLRSLKGWTGPKEVDGLKVEGFWRAHQAPVDNARSNDEHRTILEGWMRSYRPEELFDADGRLRADLRALAPTGNRRMGANPHANGGLLKRELKLRISATMLWQCQRRAPSRARPRAQWGHSSATSSRSTPRPAISA
jgi:phosphoketolase